MKQSADAVVHSGSRKTGGVVFAAGPARDGGVWVRSEQCATCIFRPGNLMHLKPGVVAQMKLAADERGTCIACHESMNGPDAAVCAGYFEHHNSALLQIAERLGVLRKTAASGLRASTERPQ